MKKIVLISVLILGGWYTHQHFNKPSAFIANQKPWGGTIVAFGDSLTAGHGAEPQQSYPVLLEELLGAKIINLGRNGDTMQQGWERLERDVLAKKPQIVIMTLGGNDIIRRINLQDTVQAAEKIFRKLVGAGVMVVFIEIDPPLVGNKRMRAIREMAEPLGVVWLEGVMTGLWGNSKLMADNIHPNAAGYRVMAERIADQIKRMGH